ncbi:MAG TPA: GNAT family N-acetyltransferase [Gemmatimonadales bacterium]|nr:GNAT family N-acetyltransferase [Gemmatimonadales bacterium]
MTAIMNDTRLRWHLHSTCPPDWALHIERSRAGLFHSPAGLAASTEQGEPFFAKLVEGNEVVGIAAGVHRRCRMPPLPKHAHLPSPPVVVCDAGIPASAMLDSLVACAEREGWADLNVASMEAHGAVPIGGRGTPLQARHEYDLPLAGSFGDLARRLTSHHRRRLPPDGEWTLKTLSGAEARAMVAEVTTSARRRASSLRRGFDDVTLPPAHAFREDPAWGLTTYAAMRGDAPLAAALVGWAGKRAYYVSGGSTPDGYARNASVWLHLQVAAAFQSAGFTHYCLGGAPASAVDPNDPSHGLHRFKTGFGAVVRTCTGARWVFSNEHEAGHRLTRWIRDQLASEKETA